MNDIVWERCYLPWWYKKFFPFKKTIRLGLDLQGGTHLVLRVDVNKALINKTARLSEDIADFLIRNKFIKKTDKRVKFRNNLKSRINYWSNLWSGYVGTILKIYTEGY